jgi:hypothetical protein
MVLMNSWIMPVLRKMDTMKRHHWSGWPLEKPPMPQMKLR